MSNAVMVMMMQGMMGPGTKQGRNKQSEHNGALKLSLCPVVRIMVGPTWEIGIQILFILAIKWNYIYRRAEDFW